MFFFCRPQEDTRTTLLKQVATTGCPARSSRTSKSSDERLPTLSGVPPPPPSPPRQRSSDRGPDRSDQLSVDVSTIYEDIDELDASIGSIGAFHKRAFVAQGEYRVGWLLDSETSVWYATLVIFISYAL